MRLLPYAAAVGVPLATAAVVKGVVDLSLRANGMDPSVALPELYSFLPVWTKAGLGVCAAAIACGLAYGTHDIVRRHIE